MKLFKLIGIAIILTLFCALMMDYNINLKEAIPTLFGF